MLCASRRVFETSAAQTFRTCDGSGLRGRSDCSVARRRRIAWLARSMKPRSKSSSRPGLHVALVELGVDRVAEIVRVGVCQRPREIAQHDPEEDVLLSVAEPQ